VAIAHLRSLSHHYLRQRSTPAGCGRGHDDLAELVTLARAISRWADEIVAAIRGTQPPGGQPAADDQPDAVEQYRRRYYLIACVWEVTLGSAHQA
jgi:hypothetical protein